MKTSNKIRIIADLDLNTDSKRIEQIKKILSEIREDLVKFYYLSGWKVVCLKCSEKFYRLGHLETLCPSCKYHSRLNNAMGKKKNNNHLKGGSPYNKMKDKERFLIGLQGDTILSHKAWIYLQRHFDSYETKILEWLSEEAIAQGRGDFVDEAFVRDFIAKQVGKK
jgi:hypothetical protein